MSAGERARVEPHRLYVTADSTFVSVPILPSANEIFVEVWPQMAIGAEQTALRDELIADVGRYKTSNEQWLGVPLGPDRFPAFKGKRLAIVSGAGSRARCFEIWALEHLDLTNDGEL